MIRLESPALFAMLAFTLATAPVLDAQGKGKGQGGGQAESRGKGQGRDKEKGSPAGETRGQGREKERGNAERRERGNDRGSSDVARGNENSRGNAASRGRSGKAKFVRVATPGTMPQSVRRFANSRRAQDLIVAAAMSHALARGRDDDFRITQDGGGWRVLNLRGDQLVFLDEGRARDLGRWRVGVIDEGAREGAPSFCRSGEGHPVWGRQWCLDKRFGLGDYDDFSWGRRIDPGDIEFRQPSLRDQLVGAALEQVLGTTAYNRLALHAVTLGLVEPLAGTWYTEPTGPQLLRINSGVYPVAEMVDTNRDFRVDDLIIALRSWL